MIIWFALLIPLVVAGVLFVFFRRSVTWWELLIPLGLSLVLVTIFKLTIETAQVTDREYWGGWVVNAQYYEEWNEEVPCVHTRTDSKGNVIGYQHLYDVSYHGPYWQVNDSNGQTIMIGRSRYKQLVKQFGNKHFVDLHRDYHSVDGDMYETVWNGDAATREPVVTEHYYENRVQASSSVFKFGKVDPKQYHLFDYPRVRNWYELPSVLGYSGPDSAVADRRLTQWNTTLGHAKEVRLWILVFRNQPVQAGFAQENYWQGGNMNEFVLTIGVDNRNHVQWAHPFSWTEKDQLAVTVRDYVARQDSLDLNRTIDWLGPQIQAQFVRRDFHKDFGYLTVEPPMWAVIMTYIVTLVANIGVSVWIINNEFADD